MPEVAVVAEDRMLQTQTTRSWSFLGLDSRSPPLGLWNRTDGRDVVVGILDTGKESLHRCCSVWPEHPSFWNQSLGAVPAHFKGNCKATGAAFASRLCNQSAQHLVPRTCLPQLLALRDLASSAGLRHGALLSELVR
eukprot:SM000257S08647  [mRNA]  locus=s257:35331:35851:- [translate_table: standard]